MHKKILALTFCVVLLIPQDSLGQSARTLSLLPESETTLLEAPKPKPIPQDSLGQSARTLSLLPESETTLLEAPKPKPAHTIRNVFIANALIFGASVADAKATAYGSGQCRAEQLRWLHTLRYFGSGAYGGQFHPYLHAFSLTLPLDIGVAGLSILMYKKHHDTLAVLFPISSASAQISSAGLKYSVGCF
jgi:hypothetical protein